MKPGSTDDGTVDRGDGRDREPPGGWELRGDRRAEAEDCPMLESDEVLERRDRYPRAAVLFPPPPPQLSSDGGDESIGGDGGVIGDTFVDLVAAAIGEKADFSRCCSRCW